MKILTVRQPWAWSIIYAGKDVENRSTNIAGSYRGLVAIHAGLKNNKESWRLFQDSAPNAADLEEKILAASVYGSIIGVVDLIDVHTSAGAQCASGSGEYPCSPWALASEKYHLVLARPRSIEPIPYKGFLGLRSITDEEIIASIKKQLA